MAAVSTGCRTHLTDLTMAADVQQSGILGQQFHTTKKLLLVKDRAIRLLFLATPNFRFSEPDDYYKSVLETNYQYKQVGVLEAGTKLQVNQVVQVKEPAWVLPWVPAYYIWNCTLARVEDGPYAGKEVAIVGDGIWSEGGAVVLGSPLLWPVNQASMISVFYNMHSFSFRPTSEKYDFYDSGSNLFATVTLIPPVPDFPMEKFDGMWFGSLAGSYIPPKSHYTLMSDKLNARDLYRFTGTIECKRPLVAVINLNPNEPIDDITLYMSISEPNRQVTGRWVHFIGAVEVESGTFVGPFW